MRHFRRRVHGARLAVPLALSLCIAPAIASTITAHGRVTDFVSGQPLAGAQVQLAINSDAAVTRTLDDGTYALSVDSNPQAGDLANVQAFDNDHLYEVKTFDAAQGTAGVDFALHLPASVYGIVRDAAAAPLPSAPINALVRTDAGWEIVLTRSSLNDGSFRLDRMAPGEYRICAGGIGSAFARKCFDNVVVDAASDIDAASPVVLVDGETRSNVDFTLAEGGSLAGTLTNRRSGGTLGNVPLTIALYDAAGHALETLYLYTNAAGAYRIEGVPDGAFYVTATIASSGFRGTQLYSDVDCPQGVCASITSGRSITIANHAAVTGVDFSFQPVAVVRGTVTDRTSGAPLGGVEVSACIVPRGLFPDCVNPTFSNSADGHYELSIDSRDYIVFASAGDDHVNQIYPDRSCLDPWCAYDTHVSIHAAEGGDYAGTDFALHRSAHISGTISDGVTGEPVNGAAIAMFDSNYHFVFSFYSTEDGSYITPKWAGGTYYMAAYYSWNFRCTFYLDRPCPQNASDPDAIAAMAPTAILFADGETVGGIDMRLPAELPLFVNGFESPPTAR